MKILFAAGGTGGHINPALVLALVLKKEFNADVRFVGTGRELEEKLIVGSGFPLQAVPFVAITGKGFSGVWQAIRIFPKSFLAVRRILVDFKPDVVVGFGGYPTVLPLLAAFFARIPTGIQEQNAQVGLANKFLSLLASRIFAVPEAKGFWRPEKNSAVFFRAANPVKEEIYKIPEWKLPEAGINLLVLGGSQGAKTLNEAVLDLVEVFKAKKVNVLHQAGKAHYQEIVAAYRERNFPAVDVREFITDMPTAYREAHLIISRAGAMTVAEITAARRPAIYVPLAIARAHQRENIAGLVAAKTAICVEQSINNDLSERLKVEVESLLNSPDELFAMVKRMREQFNFAKLTPAAAIAEEIVKLANAKSKNN